jgi:uncharacterized protein
MNTKKAVDDFLSQKTIALVGLSRKGNHFSNMACKELKKKGYAVVPVNPSATEIDGEKCYPDLGSVKDLVDAALIMTPSSQVAAVVQDAADNGIRNVWIQQGAETDEAIELGNEKGLSLVSGECIMMFAEPTAFLHRFHRWVWARLGKLPK